MKFGPSRGNPIMIFEHFFRDFGILVTLIVISIWKTPAIWKDNIAFLVIAVISPFSTLSKYLFTKYSITDDKMIVNSGMFVKKTMEIPLKSITTVDLTQNLLFQIFQVYKIKVDNSSQTNDTAQNAEIVIALKKDSAFYVKSLLDKKEDLKEEEEEQGKTEKALYPAVTCSVLEFFLLGILQSKIIYILTLFSTIFGGGGYLYSFLKEQVDASVFAKITENIFSSAVGIALFALVVYMMSIISSAVVTATKYFDYTVTARNNALQVTYGLFTKKSYTLVREKISGVTIKQSLLMRIFGYCTIEVYIIGYGDKSESNQQEVSLLYPIIKLEQVDGILQQLLPEMTFSREYHKSEKRTLPYFFLCFRMFLAIVAVIGLIIESFLFQQYVESSLALGIIFVILIAAVFSVYREYRTAGIYANKNVVSICRGVFSREMVFIKTEKIESVSEYASIWKKKNGYTSIRLGFHAPLRVANIKSRNVNYKEYEEIQKVLNY